MRTIIVTDRHKNHNNNYIVILTDAGFVSLVHTYTKSLLLIPLCAVGFYTMSVLFKHLH